jgi:hypothetical protein
MCLFVMMILRQQIRECAIIINIFGAPDFNLSSFHGKYLMWRNRWGRARVNDCGVANIARHVRV